VREWYPGESGSALDVLLTVLERAGLVSQTDVTYREDRYVRKREGGTVAVTPFGVAYAVEAARRAGCTVLEDRDPGDLTVEELAARADDEERSPASWWDDVCSWLGAQGDRHESLEQLVSAVDPLHLAIALNLSPVELRAELLALAQAVAVRSTDADGAADDVAESERDAIVVSWLLDADPSIAAELGPDRAFDNALLTLEVLAGTDDEFAIDMLSDGREISDQTTLIEAVAQRGRPSGLRLLETVGRAHPDKQLSKLARKEAFRLRSRLANSSPT
jgi:hypothetical protein